MSFPLIPIIIIASLVIFTALFFDLVKKMVKEALLASAVGILGSIAVDFFYPMTGLEIIISIILIAITMFIIRMYRSPRQPGTGNYLS